MKQLFHSIILIFAFGIITSCSQQAKEDYKSEKKLSPAQTLLKKCIAFHDPQANWQNFSASITGKSTFFTYDDDKKDTIITERISKIMMDNAKAYLEVHRTAEGYALKRKVMGESICESTWEKPKISAEDSVKQRLNCESAKRYRNYYRYLIGLPMVLNDKSAIMKNKVTTETVDGKTYQVLTVNYEPLEKEPTWYFYINPETFQLERTKFVKPTEEGKEPEGEIIDFPNITTYQGMKPLATFKWMFLNGQRLGDEDYTYEALEQ